MTKECGKGIVEGRADVTEGIHMVQYVFGTVRMPHGDVIDSEIPEKTHSCAENPRELLRQLHRGTFHLPSPCGSSALR